MAGALTAAGWPRPIIDGLPIPWVSPSTNLAKMDPAREAACASGAICAVCGLGYEEDEEAYILVKGRKQVDLAKVEAHPIDNGVMHKRCLLLSLARCPRLRQMQADDDLTLLRTTGNCAKPRFKRGTSELFAIISGGDCSVVAIDDLRTRA